MPASTHLGDVRFIAAGSLGAISDQVVRARPRVSMSEIERRLSHRAGIEGRDLVVLQVGVDEARRRVVAGDDLDGPAVHAVALEPGAILGEVLADAADQHRPLPRSPRLKAMFAPVPPRSRVSESTRNDTLRTCILSGRM